MRRRMKLIHGDCLKELKNIPDASVDLLLTDPPYGMSYQSSWRTDKFNKIAGDDDVSWFPEFAAECFRVLKDNTHAYIFCNDYAISDFRRHLEQAGFKLKRTLVWVKNNHTSGDLYGDYGNKTEFVLFAHKGRRTLNGKRDTNVLLFDRVASTVHPTQKPPLLCEYLIAKSTQPGELVLDPFLGSGTTAIAAKSTGRNFIGIEREAEYVEIARARIAGTPPPQPRLLAAE